jgi:protein TonB
MFRLFAGDRGDRATGRRRIVTVLVSIAIHTVIIAAVVVVPILYFTDQLPAPHEILSAFVQSAGPITPPPPPPPPPQAGATATPKAVPTTGRTPLPTVTPAAAEVPVTTGGVSGGVMGGVAGGTVGGIVDMSGGGEGPVRIGGQVKAPDLVHRVEPQYPLAARQARLEGIVVLEATVDTSGRVQSVHVLRGSAILNGAAIDAVKQWRYSPLVLNDAPTAFILTVTVNFKLQ